MSASLTLYVPYAVLLTVSNDFYRQLGQRLQRARKSSGMSQAQLAAQLGLSRTRVTNIEKGTQPLQVHTLVKAARALNVLVDDLLPDDDATAAERTGLYEGMSPDEVEWVARHLSRASDPVQKRVPFKTKDRPT